MRYFAPETKKMQSFLYQNEKNTDNIIKTIIQLRGAGLRLSQLLILLFLFTMTYPSFASNIAVVRSTWATIYADLDLQAPIGKLSQGTKLKVGEKLRRHGTIAISTHQNKMIYIRAKDLTISGVKDQFEVQTSRYKVLETQALAMEPKASRGFLSLYAGQGVPGKEWNQLAKEMESDNAQAFYAFGMQAKYNHHQNRYSLSVNFELSNSFDSQVQMQAFSLETALHFALLNYGLMSWEIFAGPLLTPNMLIQTENKQYYTKGSGYGYKLGTELHFLNFWSYHLSGGAVYRYQKLSGHEEIQLPGQYRRLTSLNSYSEMRLFVALNKDFQL